MSTLTHDTVADFFIVSAHKHGDCLTNLKLQKLVYYAQAWSLGLRGEEIFDADFQAWVHGPVCPALYARFKEYRWNPITIQPELPKIPDEIESHLIDVYEAYEQFSGYQLEKMTHAEDPWIIARDGIPLDEASNAVIHKEEIRDFYSRLACE